jgi:excisionase family DNA binding protein
MTAKTESATIKVEEAAALLGIGRQTAYDLAAQGKLPGALRLGRRIVVSKKALEKFLEALDVANEMGGQDG